LSGVTHVILDEVHVRGKQKTVFDLGAD
jgi:hypothetical protein